MGLEQCLEQVFGGGSRPLNYTLNLYASENENAMQL